VVTTRNFESVIVDILEAIGRKEQEPGYDAGSGL
jgi:hypothetical protein